MANPKILIVDDEPFNLDYLEQELQDLNYETVSAVNGRDALDKVDTELPALILLDIMMPGIDGIETTLGDRKIQFTGGAQPKQWVSRVKEKLGRFSGHPQIAHWKFVADNTRHAAKVTIPSPSALHFRQGRAAVPCRPCG